MPGASGRPKAVEALMVVSPYLFTWWAYYVPGVGLKMDCPIGRRDDKAWRMLQTLRRCGKAKHEVCHSPLTHTAQSVLQSSNQYT